MNTDTTHYAILGDGRLARHMHHYLGLLEQPCSGWARNPSSALNSHDVADAELRLRRTIEPASHVLLLVSDDAIATLVRKYPFLHGRTLIHCAGALSLPGIAGAHPLMTFSNRLYTLQQYQDIPFLVETGHAFDNLFPALSNPHHTVPVEQKALYHALCVMAGNFPQILWQAVAERFKGELGVPPAVLEPYLRQVVRNFLAEPAGALTGPLARGDEQTIARNISALRSDSLEALYRAFVEVHACENRPDAGTGVAREQFP